MVLAHPAEAEKKSRGVIGFAQFTRPLEDAPSNVERLLKEVGVGHLGKTGPTSKCSYEGKLTARAGKSKE